LRKVYINCKIYGPYKSKLDERLRIVVLKNKKKTTVSYPKYLVEVELNRYLDKDETVDHIDGNFSNNDLSNLRVINKPLHSKEDAIRRKDVEISCQWCGTLFTITGEKASQRNRRTASGFCSKTCTGKYGASVQNGGSLLGQIKLDKVYYKTKSACEGIRKVEDQNIGEALTSNVDGNTEA